MILSVVLAAGATEAATPSAEVGVIAPTVYLVLLSLTLVAAGVILLLRRSKSSVV